MRSNLEDNKTFNQHFQSGRFSHTRKVAIGDIVLTTNGSLVNFIDANGSTRNVTLPVFEEGRFYVVANVGTANNLTVRNSGGVLITTLIPGDTALMFASKTEWVALRGWAALGVFTNTINGLVPAPNSGVPGSLFLRDDGQWGQVQVTGIVDAFKFITDGTTTAIGSGPDTFRLRSSTSKVGIVVTNNEAVFGDNANFTVNEANVNHDLLLNHFADEHIGHSTVTLTAGIGLAGGGNITASRTFDLDLNDLTTDAPVLADTFAFYDVSGLDTNKATLTTLNGILNHNALLNYVADQHVAHTGVSIITGATSGLSGGGDITASRTLLLNINGLTADVPAIGDSIPFFDLSGSDTNKATFTQVNAILDHNALLNYVANQHIDHSAVVITTNEGIQGGGSIAASRTFKLDINGLTVDATPDSANDYVVTYDASATSHKKVLISNLPTVGFNITGLTPFSAIDVADEMPVYDVSAAGPRKITVANFKVAFEAFFVSGVAAQTFTVTQKAQARSNISVPLKGFLFGLTLSTAGASTTFGVAVGEAADGTGADLMALTSAYTKTTSAWAVGTATGALDTGTIAANTWYHVFLIKRPDTGVVDILFSLNVTVGGGLVLPTNYTLFRRIGSMRTNGSSQWTSFTQTGDIFNWAAPVADLAGGSWTSTASDQVLTVPTNVVVAAFGNIAFSSSTGVTYAAIYSKQFPDYTINNSTGQIVAQNAVFRGVSLFQGILTDTSATIRKRSSDASGTGDINTLGWVDTRGKLN